MKYYQVDRTSVELERVTSLEAVVLLNVLTLTPDSLIPTVGQTERHYSITLLMVAGGVRPKYSKNNAVERNGRRSLYSNPCRIGERFGVPPVSISPQL